MGYQGSCPFQKTISLSFFCVILKGIAGNNKFAFAVALPFDDCWSDCVI